MFLKIKNKNNNKEYEIRTGLTISDNYNETLDSATINISHTTDSINIEPFDECEIISNEVIKGFILESDNRYHYYMAVDSYQRQQLSVGENPYFSYEIKLFSQLKYLEGIILPSLKITRGKEPRKIFGESYEKWGYLDNYLREYGALRRINTSSGTTFVPKWKFAERVKTRFKDINCPEMQWNNPTLRQVITDLMMVDDCIPVLKNGVIDYIDLTETKNEIRYENDFNKPLVNFIQENQSSSDYVSELRMDIQNAIEKDNLVEVAQRICFRNNDVGVMTDQDYRLETQYPIYELEHLRMTVWGQADASGSSAGLTYYPVTIDLVNEGVCVEKGVYDTKPIWYKEGLFGGIGYKFADVKQYQNLNVFYKRGGNTIEGWGVLHNEAYWGSSNYRALDTITTCAINSIDQIQWINDEGMLETVFLTPDKPEFRSVIQGDLLITFDIEYKTTADALFQASKGNKPTNERVVVDNQTNSYVETNLQGLLEYMKANRLGNKMKLINARYEKQDFDKIADLGDTCEGSIIFKRDISYFDDYAMANYYATEGYVLRNYFTGVKAKQRSWKLVNGSDALTRHDLMKYYLCFDNKDAVKKVTDKTANLPSILYGNKIETSILKDGNTQFKNCAVKFYTKEGWLPKTELADYYETEIVRRKVGKSLVYTFGLKDNIFFSKYIKGKTEDNKKIGGYAQWGLPYADSDGENTSATIIFTTNISGISEENTLPRYNPNLDPTNNLLKAQKSTFLRPALVENQISKSSQTQFLYIGNKDNSEITKLSIQLELCNTKNAIVSDKFIYKGTKMDVSVYQSNTNVEERYLTEKPNDLTLIDDATIQILDNKLSVVSQKLSKRSIYIVDTRTEEVLLAWNINANEERDVSSVYVNLLRVRDENIYDANGYIVGNIYNNN